MTHPSLALAALVWTGPAFGGTASGNLITLTRELQMRDGLCISLEIHLDHAAACTVTLDGATAVGVADALRACPPPGVVLVQRVEGACVHLREEAVPAGALLDTTVRLTPGRRTLSEVADEIDALLRARRDPASPTTLLRVRAEAGTKGRSTLLVEVRAGKRPLREVLSGLVVVDAAGSVRDVRVTWIAYSSASSEVILLVPVGPPPEAELGGPSRIEALLSSRAEIQRMSEDPSTSAEDRRMWVETLAGIDRQIEAERRRTPPGP